MYKSILATAIAGLLSWQVTTVFAQDSTPGGPTFPNTVKNCNAWHTVEKDDVCTKLFDLYHITRSQFHEYNPDVSEDCSQNFWGGYAYCVGVGSTSTSSSRASSDSTVPSTSKATTTEGSSKSSRSSTTSKATTSADGSYSIREPIANWTITSSSIATTFPPSPTQAGQASNCVNWKLVQAGDTCEKIVARSPYMTLSQFMAANPGVGEDCESLWLNWWVCVQLKAGTPTYQFDYSTGTGSGNTSVPDATSYTPSSLPTVNSSFVPEPTMGPMASDCRAYYLTSADDTCRSVPQVAEGIVSEENFLEWNPPVKACNGLWLGYWYCAVAGDKEPPVPTTTIKPTSTPLNQAGDCNKWYRARSDDETCELLVEVFATFDKNNFMYWNPSVGNNCDIKRDVYYCIGVKGSATSRTDRSVFEAAATLESWQTEESPQSLQNATSVGVDSTALLSVERTSSQSQSREATASLASQTGESTSSQSTDSTQLGLSATTSEAQI